MQDEDEAARERAQLRAVLEPHRSTMVGLAAVERGERDDAYGYRGRPEHRDHASERARLGDTPNPYPDQDGCWSIPSRSAHRVQLRVIASAGGGWEHVSVSAWAGSKMLKRVPTWEEMCQVRDLFWGPEACVVQYHPPASRYVNVRQVLHLWRPAGRNLPMPPLVLV